MIPQLFPSLQLLEYFGFAHNGQAELTLDGDKTYTLKPSDPQRAGRAAFQPDSLPFAIAERNVLFMNSIKEDLKENFISEEEYWQYNKEYSDKIKKIKEDIQLYEEEKETIKNNDTDWMNIFKKKEKINELNRLLIDELIEDIVIEKDNNLKIIFKCEDKYFEALDFINKQNYDIISSS